MYCPKCGSQMVTAEPETKPDYYSYMCEPDLSVKWGCPQGCFHAQDYPLIQHGAYGGHESAPGDSWSLTWLK